ncbi:PREDICTED: NAD(P)(+)--arginine ADP-ribosyltransferase 2-like [Calidris pugnax]|uniref:NAD(P)(+)--arginine ADP-ribosyltransferase 2-like n=1 Tax=Calidris pugnax TaxID=198806 RepID=UPI00071C72D1|nr:PREDICTED: NAD(P)(+)--arginine ADP-ribosyltransferase 2-like [Calidris pugnax]
MEHLVLGLVLFAGTLAAGNPLQDLGPIKQIKLDMACTSFDDQYRGCGHQMDKELGKLHQMELTKNSIYAHYWPLAAAEWKKRAAYVPRPPALRAEHATALLAYSRNGSLYKAFNTAVREAGRSRNVYLYKFHFKTLHYLLTQALKILRNAQPNCYHVYRGNRNIHFTAKRHDLIRFGQFASTSFVKETAEFFGRDTFFSLSTYHGFPIRNFSFFPNVNEVLVPPYETFEVIDIRKQGNATHIKLLPKGTYSRYNCEWLKGKQHQNQKRNFKAGDPGAPAANGEGDPPAGPPLADIPPDQTLNLEAGPSLGTSLLLEDTALAAAGEP